MIPYWTFYLPSLYRLINLATTPKNYQELVTFQFLKFCNSFTFVPFHSNVRLVAISQTWQLPQDFWAGVYRQKRERETIRVNFPFWSVCRLACGHYLYDLLSRGGDAKGRTHARYRGPGTRRIPKPENLLSKKRWLPCRANYHLDSKSTELRSLGP